MPVDALLVLILWLRIVPLIVDCTQPPVCGRSIYMSYRLRRSVTGPTPPVKVPDIKEFPFLASIRTYVREEDEESFLVDDGNFVGTLLGPYEVLTSCICVANELGPVGQSAPKSLRDPTFFGVTAGTLFDLPSADKNSQFRWGWKLLVHPKCLIGDTSASYDVALLVVEKPFKLTPNSLVPLPNSTLNFKLPNLIDAKCRTVGWGWEVYGYEALHRLIEPPASLQLSISCAESFGTAFTHEESCVHLHPTVLYTGDAGSPILCSSNGGRAYVGMRTTREVKNDTHSTMSFMRFDDEEVLKWIENTFLDHPTPRNSQMTAHGSAAVVVFWSALLLLVGARDF